ncbi:MAG: DEAD/DEAH box helicase [Clostridia bacterium]|nr:DEAD/DEAH box helicase [Clostridia bacterium]
MSEAEALFSRYAFFIREFIYSHGWKTLNAVQLEAGRVIFEEEENLLLSSPTASGKTEAVFFPILTQMYEAPKEVEGVEVLYIAPLKSLINDQYVRLEELLYPSHIPLFRWHGDVASSQKKKLLDNPRGVLQITPESLESLFIHRYHELPRLFGGLRYVILDEMHTMIGTDRGNQVLCLLSRLSRLTKNYPRRIGLSATIGNREAAMEWIENGSGHKTVCPIIQKGQLSWRLGFAHFYTEEGAKSKLEAPKGAEIPSVFDQGFSFIYEAVRQKKCLVFSNSREETELVTASLRQIAKSLNEKDRFYIHHGNLSAAIRNDAEQKMKDEEENIVTCATVSMELGIDIGKLERVVQLNSPHSVSALLQRLGRSGRREMPPEMLMVFREDTPLPSATLPELFPWELLRGIALVQLYSEERFIETPTPKKMPLSLAFHQTLSILASCGELSPRELADRVLSLPPLQHIEREAYRALLVSMVKGNYLELMDEGGLIVGLAGEKLVTNFRFYAVFQEAEEFSVRSAAGEIGTIANPLPPGERFALAGRVWEVLEADVAKRLLFVKGVEGKMAVSWPGGVGEIHTRVLQRMLQVLLEDTKYPYLMPKAQERLDKARELARRTSLADSVFIPLGETTAALFPWLGTRSFQTLRRYLSANAARLGISHIEYQGCCYMTFHIDYGKRDAFLQTLCRDIRENGIDLASLVGDSERPTYDKYDVYLETSLLREAFVKDRLLADEIVEYIAKRNGVPYRKD